MDGRAQAAYNHDKFSLWQYLYAGGQHAGPIRGSNRRATGKETEVIGKWLDPEMKKRKIWVFIFPNSQFSVDPDPRKVNYFPLALSRHKDWKMVYMDDDQQMYVDISTEKGRKLANDIYMDNAKFPNKYAKSLVLSRIYLSTRDKKNPMQDKKNRDKGVGHAKKAFELNPSYISTVTLVNIASGRYANIEADIREDIRAYVEKYVTDFRENKDTLKNGSAYSKKLSAANVVAGYLGNYYKKKNKELAVEYKTNAREWYAERKKISYAARW